MRIAAYQFAVCSNAIDNYNKITNAIFEAKARGAELIVFPECALTGYPPRDMADSSCVDYSCMDNLYVQIQKTVDDSNIAVIVGSICKDDNSAYNRALVFQPGRKVLFYDKRALWGWDRDNFTPGNAQGIFEINNIRIGIRICFEVRFPEYFRELYKNKSDLNIVLFYDVSDTDDSDRYNMIKGHLQTRAVENVTPILAVNAISPFQTAPTIVIGKSGQIMKECRRNQQELLIYDFEKTEDNFGEQGRRTFSDILS